MDHPDSPPDLATLVATSPDGMDPADAMRLAALMIDLGGDAGRAAMIYLAMSVHAEERRREKLRGDGLTMPMSMDTWDDAWKRRD